MLAFWAEVVALVRDDFTVIRLDLRGHGDSGRANDYSPVAMAADVAAVVDAAGAARPVIVGHSLGAHIATAFAADADVRLVVNVDSPLRLSAGMARLCPYEKALRGPGFRDVLIGLFDATTGDRLSVEATAAVDAYVASSRQDVVVGVYAQVFTHTDAELDDASAAMLKRVRAPYLAVLGDDPPPGYVEWLTNLLPSVRIEAWPGYGHFLHLVDPQRFVELVRAHLDDGLDT